MKTKTLEGEMLDYYVALAHGMVKIKKPIAKGKRLTEFWGYPDGTKHPGPRVSVDAFKPSSDHGWGGPITEREGICTVKRTDAKEWFAVHPVNSGHGYTGHSPLVASMRAFVASKFGDEVPDIEDAK